MQERRKHQRFKLDGSCIVNHSDVVGTIADISLGGMSCFCLETNCCQPGSYREVGIYCSKKPERVEKLMVKVMGAEYVPGKFSKKLGTCRCRLQFAHLADVQIGQLESIILTSVLAGKPAP